MPKLSETESASGEDESGIEPSSGEDESGEDESGIESGSGAGYSVYFWPILFDCLPSLWWCRFSEMDFAVTKKRKKRTKNQIFNY